MWQRHLASVTMIHDSLLIAVTRSFSWLVSAPMSWLYSLPIRKQFKTSRPRQDGRHHFPDDILKWIFLNENVWISIKIPLKFVPSCPINNIPALFYIMAWPRPCDKPLSAPMMVSLLTNNWLMWHQFDLWQTMSSWRSTWHRARHKCAVLPITDTI